METWMAKLDSPHTSATRHLPAFGRTGYIMMRSDVAVGPGPGRDAEMEGRKGPTYMAYNQQIYSIKD